MFDREWNNPKTLSSHKTTQITTTAFKMDLMLPAMGMKRFTSQSKTPTTIRVIRMGMRGMLFTFPCVLRDTATQSRRTTAVSPVPRGFADSGVPAEETGLAKAPIRLPQRNLGPWRDGCL